MELLVSAQQCAASWYPLHQPIIIIIIVTTELGTIYSSLAKAVTAAVAGEMAGGALAAPPLSVCDHVGLLWGWDSCCATTGAAQTGPDLLWQGSTACE
jgi:hypothetical protein